MAKGSGSGWLSPKVIAYGVIAALVLYVAIDFFR